MGFIHQLCTHLYVKSVHVHGKKIKLIKYICRFLRTLLRVLSDKNFYRASYMFAGSNEKLYRKGCVERPKWECFLQITIIYIVTHLKHSKFIDIITMLKKHV